LNRIFPLVFVVILTFPCFAKPLDDRPRLTGQQLVDMLSLPPGTMNALELPARQQHEHQRAQAYIDGVIDASRGSAWCSNGRWKPDTLDENVIWGMRATAPDKLQGPAGPLIVEILSSLLPCSTQNRSMP